MRYSLFIKRSFSYPLFYINKVAGYFRSNNEILILMYHRVMDRNKYPGLIQDAMYVNVDTFEKQIIYLKNNFDLVNLETIYNLRKEEVTGRRKKPLCCITFDDGWKDFYDNAFGVIRKHKACGTVFLPTEYIGTNRQLWTDLLASVISGIGNVPISVAPDRSKTDLLYEIEHIRGSLSDRYEKAIDLLKIVPSKDIDEILERLVRKWKIDLTGAGRSFLSWEEVKEMRNSGFVSFGSHTKNHRILTTLREGEIREELTQSRKKLIEEGVVSETFVPFAYPNGNHTDRIAKLVEEVGYNLALTTSRGWNMISQGEMDLFKLKRVGVHEDMTLTNEMFACRVHGYY